MVVFIKKSFSSTFKEVLAFFRAQHLIPMPIPKEMMLKIIPTKNMFEDWIFKQTLGLRLFDESYHLKLVSGQFSTHEC